jgi:hypothetical protein
MSDLSTVMDAEKYSELVASVSSINSENVSTMEEVSSVFAQIAKDMNTNI